MDTRTYREDVIVCKEATKNINGNRACSKEVEEEQRNGMRRLCAGVRDYTRLLNGFGAHLLPDTSQAYQTRMLSTEHADEERSSSPASSWAGVEFVFEVVRLDGVNTTGATLFVVAGVEPIFPWTTGVGSSGSIVSASSGVFTVSVAIIPNIAPE